MAAAWVHPELRAGLEVRRHVASELPRQGDGIAARRRHAAARFAMLGDPFPEYAERVASETLHIPVSGAEIPVHVTRARGTEALADSIVVYLHGGGMMRSDLDNYLGLVQRYAVDMPNAVFVVPEYRLAPEHSGSTLVSDCVDAVRWAWGRRGVLASSEDARLGIFGASAGGGLAAAVAHAVADEGEIELAFQVLIAPMLDDRPRSVSADLDAVATWRAEDNEAGWRAFDAGARGVDTSAPARRADLAGQPAAFIEVGDLDIFAEEDVAYAVSLMRCGVPVDLIVRAGVVHAFEPIAPHSALTERAIADRVDFMRRHLGGSGG